MPHGNRYILDMDIFYIFAALFLTVHLIKLLQFGGLCFNFDQSKQR